MRELLSKSLVVKAKNQKETKLNVRSFIRGA